MKNIKTYEDFINEEINLKSALLGAALGAATLGGINSYTNKDKEETHIVNTKSVEDKSVEVDKEKDSYYISEVEKAEKDVIDAKMKGEYDRERIEQIFRIQKEYLDLTKDMTGYEIVEFTKNSGMNFSKLQGNGLNITIQKEENGEWFCFNEFDAEKQRIISINKTLKIEIDALEKLKELGKLSYNQEFDLKQKSQDYRYNKTQIDIIKAKKQKAIMDLNRNAEETLKYWKAKNGTE